MVCPCITLTHALVHSHTVFIVVGKVGLIGFPCCVGYWSAIQPAGMETKKVNMTSLIKKKKCFACISVFIKSQTSVEMKHMKNSLFL